MSLSIKKYFDLNFKKIKSMKKKILFLVTHSIIFKGFFQSEIKNLSKIYDIYFLVSKYGFDNFEFRKKQRKWYKDLEKKKITKKIFFLEQISYSNFYKSITFNIKLISILKNIKKLNIDIFLLPNKTYYWEEIFFEYFKNKKIFCYLTNPPSGLDLFNNFHELKKSIKNKKIFKTFMIKSDSKKLHSFNTNELNNKNLFILFFQKVNIFFSKFINHYLFPFFLIGNSIQFNSIYYQLNLNFLFYPKIIIFNPVFKVFINKLVKNKNNEVYLCSKNFKRHSKMDYNWIFAYSSNNKILFLKLFKYLIMLKKLNKLNKIYLKGHPTWQHSSVEIKYIKLLEKNGIKFQHLSPYDNINYSKYFGLISTPSSVMLEANYNCPNMKIIGIKKSENLISGLLNKFYRAYDNKVIWEPNFKNLKIYLNNDHGNKMKNNNLKNYY